MADKELKFKVTTEADTSGLEDIENALNNLEDKTITIRPEIQSMELEEVENRIEELEQKRAEIYMGVDDTPLEEVEAELEELEARQIELTIEADSSSVDEATDKIEEVDGKEANVTVNADTTGAEESINGLESAISALGSGAALAGLEQMVATAGNIQDSWNRLGLTFGEVTGQMKTDVSEAGEATGRSGSLIRGYFNDMGIAGVTNTELLQQSFEALSGRAYQTGNSIESMEQKMKMMVMSGNAGARQLTGLGISTEALGRAMGVSASEATKMFKSLSQEERLRVLTKAMGDGKQANEQYKNSWQGLKDQVNKVTAALMGAVGEMILPILIPAMKVATQAITALAEGFKALPAPIKGVIGGVLAVVMGFLALTTVISTIKAVANAIQFVSTATQLLSGVTKIATAAQNALNLSMLANPVLLLAAALAVLIGYMVYLYNTNEQCRQSVNQLGTDLQRLASGDFSSIKDIGNDILAASDSFAQASGFAALIGEENYNRWVELRNGMAQTVGDMLTNAGQQIMLFGEQVNTIFQQAILSIQNFGMWIYQTFMQVIMTIQQFGMQLLQLPMYIVQAVQQGVASFQSFVGQVSGILSNVIGIVVSFGGQLISQLGSAASNAASSFLSGISGLASGFMGELSSMLSYAVSWASSLASAMASAAANAVSSFLGALQIHSPGIMQRKFIGEMEGIVTAATDTGAPLGSAMRDVGNNAVSNFDIRGLNTPTVPTSGTQPNARGVTMNIVINGDVDNEERMEKFADYIINRMNWDNETANRTV